MHVPRRIALEEILPKARAEPGFLGRAGYRIVPTEPEGGAGEAVGDDGAGAAGGRPRRDGEDGRGGDSRDGGRDWAAIAEGLREGRLRIQQRPGPESALGRAKFLFPNQHAVYLHDAPERELFRRSRRTFSHGCIRVARPGELVAFCLTGGAWDRGAIREAMGSTRTRRITLEDPVPVYILYLTAFTDPEGRAAFREDVYGYDAALAEALAADTPGPEEREAARRACEDLSGRL